MFEAGFNFDKRAEASPSEKNFVAREYPLHRAARFARKQRDYGFDAGVILAAVTAADRRNYDANPIQRQLEHFGELLLQR